MKHISEYFNGRAINRYTAAGAGALRIVNARAPLPDQTLPMSDNQQPPQPRAPEKVSCRQCGRELPPEEAIGAEARDYVLWFCGLDCYQAWRRERDAAEPD